MNAEARELLLDDPALGPLVETHGELPLEPAEDPFRRLVVSIIRQQLSMESGAAIQDRLFDAVEITPAGVLAAEEETLLNAGLSAAKADYVRAVAEYFRDLEEGYFTSRTDSEVMAELTEIHGIGPWTAKMFLLFGLGREDVFPVEDLGIRKGMAALFDEELTRGEMRTRAEAWAPYRSYASCYLWRAVEG